jgi:hypothetical protein
MDNQTQGNLGLESLEPANKQILVVSMFGDLPSLPKLCGAGLAAEEILNTFGYIMTFTTPYDTGPVIKKCSPIHQAEIGLSKTNQGSETQTRKLRLKQDSGFYRDWAFTVFRKKSNRGFKVKTRL